MLKNKKGARNFCARAGGNYMKKFRLLVCGIASLCIMGAFVFGACDGGNENGGDNGGDNGGNVTEQPEVGTDVGDLCPDFEARIYTQVETGGDGLAAELSDETYSPEDSRGKVTVINFWGTWCRPCMNEMPYILQLAEQYADSVEVVAIHSTRVVENIALFLCEQGMIDSEVLFALDDPTQSPSIYETLAGPGVYPYTLVLDENGVIVEKFTSAIDSYAALLEHVTPYL